MSESCVLDAMGIAPNSAWQMVPMSVLMALVALGTAARAARPPHIVLALADDLGWNDLSFSGDANRMLSPRLATLAKSGVILDRYHPFKFCSPSRSQLLIGRVRLHSWCIGRALLSFRLGC